MSRLNRHVAQIVVVALASVGAEAGAQEREARSSAVEGLTRAARPGAIHGTVTDTQNVPMAGVLVSALGSIAAVAVTDDRGRFAIASLPAGAYLLRVHLPGYEGARQGFVDVAHGVRSTYNFHVRPEVARDSEAASDEAILEVLAAGFGLSLDTSIDQPETSSDASGSDRDQETIWRLRHIPRTVLKETLASAPGSGTPKDDGPARRGDSALAPTMEDSGRLAALLHAPFSGEFNILTAGVFDDAGETMFAPGNPVGIAYVTIGAPAGRHGDWSVQGAVTEGDVSSWIVAGSYAAQRSSTHAFQIGMSYSTQRYDGGNAAALAAVSDGSRNVGTIHLHDRWTLSPHLAVSYGGRLGRYDYLENSAVFSPTAGITVSPASHTRLRVSVSQRMLAPGAEEFLPPATSGLWLPPERTFAPLSRDRALRAERAREFELALERELQDAYVIGVRGFEQRVDDQLVTLFGLVVPNAPRSDLGHYYVANAGDVQVRGWGVSATATTDRLRGSVQYSVARSEWRPSVEAARVAQWSPGAIRVGSESFHDLQASVETDFRQTATRVVMFYNANTAFTNGSREAPGFGGRFNLQVNQALPFLPFASSHWEALIALRNVFREPMETASAYDELLVVRPPKRIICGVVVRF